MNKKIMYLIMLILSIQIVTALYGGETWSYHFPYCNKLIVNITGELQIDDEEYLILNNCTEISPNNYVCNCSNNYYFNVSFKTNAVNNYTFDFNYDYSKEVKPTSGSQGTSGYISSWVCGNWSECINNKTQIVCQKGKNVNYTQSKSCVSPAKKEVKVVEREVEEGIDLTERVETPEAKEPVEPERKPYIYLIKAIVTLLVIVIGLLGYFIYRKKKSNSKSKGGKKPVKTD